MQKSLSRKERICGVSAILTDHPNQLFPLSYFSEKFGAAKSTMSEDVAIIKETFQQLNLGDVEVLLGASGGVRFQPKMNDAVKNEFISEILGKLSDPSRILPGGFIYTADIFLTPKYVDQLAQILWNFFSKTNPDFVITVEAKGIPLAMAVARLFNKPLVVARKESKLTEGSVVTLNYLSGSSKRLQTMSLSKRAVKEGQRALIIDDFLAGGGTVRAIVDMMKEFAIMVVGIGVAIATTVPQRKRIDNYKSIIALEEVNEESMKIAVSSNL